MYNYNNWQKKISFGTTKLPKPQLQGLDRLLASVLVAALLILTLYMAIFSQPARLDPNLSAANHGNHAMYHAVKFMVGDSQGQSAPGAIITVGDQQLIADSKGEVYFGHLLHTRYESLVFYNNQYYRQIVAVSGTNVNLTLDAVSLDFRRLVATTSALGLVLILSWLIVSQRQHNKGRKRKHSLRRGFATSAFSLGLVIVAAGAVLPLFFSPLIAQAGSGAILDTLNTPSSINIEQDDNNAIVTWNGGASTAGSDPENVTGYKVSWGVSGQPLANTLYAQERIAQLQPLVNGQNYSLQIQSVDRVGNLSQPTATYSFTGDDNRVKALRQQMNGFFDDFNLVAGGVDERKWNEGYSLCNDSSLSAFFINNQYHSHNLINSEKCDRAQSISRPRQVFDFTNRTGTITFDFDGSFRRDFWYLEIMPNLSDVTGQVNLEATNVKAGPTNVLRIKQNDQRVEIIWVDSKGLSRTLADTDKVKTLDNLGVGLVSNVRRQWVVKLSQTNIDIQINGKKALSAKVNLPFSKAYLLWNQFSYNTIKSNQPYNLIHWDNFGFDAPADFKATSVTHNYRTAQPGGGDFMDVVKDEPATTTIEIPDKVAGAKEERLLFSMQMSGDDYEWNSQDHVLVNGIKIDVPKPQSGDLSDDELVDILSPYTVALKLPNGTLRQGQNNIEFKMLNSGVLNIHAELDFNVANAPAFTPSYQIHQTRAAIPAMADVGPGARIDQIGKAEGPFEDDKPTTVSGVVDIKVNVDNDVALHATGKNPGLTKIELLLGQEVIYKEEFSPTPAYSGTLKLDTTKYANGEYQLFLRAYNVYGTPSVPDYFQSGTKSGDYYPVIIKIQNSTPGTQVVAAVPPTPTPTEPAEETEPQPQPTAIVANIPALTPAPTAVVAVTNPGAIVAQPATPVSNEWYWLLWLGGGLYLTTGLASWGAARQRLRASTKQYVPLIALDYLLIWPFYLIKDRLSRRQKTPKGKLKD